MKTKIVEGVAKRAYAKALHLLDNTSGTRLAEGTEIPFSGPAHLFETIDEVRAMGKYPDEKQILQYVNRDQVAAARSKAMQVAFDAAGIIKPNINTDEDLRVAGMVKLLRASYKDMSDVELEALARKTLNIAAKPDSESESDDDE